MCNSVLDKMIERPDSRRYFTVRGAECPLLITAIGTPCVVNVDCRSREDEDRFTSAGIALRAKWILEECDDESLGGVARLGHRGFMVRVDSGIVSRRKPGRGGRNGTAVA